MKHLLLVLALLLAACTAGTSESHTVAIGQPAPEIRGEDVDGVPFKLSDYKGKVVVLDFWGNW
jgi:cytochrome oxidase Cu insertion factor (SCO1/SenC/PrrC family)